MTATYEELDARLRAVAADPDRPASYRSEAEGLAEGTITFCVRGGSRELHREALEARLHFLEAENPTDQDIREQHALYGLPEHRKGRPWAWLTAASGRLASGALRRKR